jgi:hypothetical protein
MASRFGVCYCDVQTSSETSTTGFTAETKRVIKRKASQAWSCAISILDYNSLCD